MSQVDFTVANADGATVRADINAMLDAIATNNSGGSEPTTKFANMWWYDTAANDLNQRNEANTAWVLAARKDPSTGWTPYRQGTLIGTASTKGSATEAAEGVAEIATQVETDAGTNDTRFVTPLKLENKPAAGFPSGTRMLFGQTAAPAGWTKETVHNNKAIRLQTGVVTSGGSVNFSTVFGTGKATASHTLSTGQIPAHSHTQRGATLTGGGQTSMERRTDTNSAITDANETSTDGGSGSGHTHNLTNLDLQFVDFIIAIKV